MIVQVASATPTMYVNNFECSDVAIDKETRTLELRNNDYSMVACFNFDNVLYWSIEYESEDNNG